MLRSILFLLLAGMMVSLAACGQGAQEEGGQGVDDSPTDPGPGEEQLQEPELNTMTLDIYFVDDQLLELKEETRELTYDTVEELLFEIWAAIQQPENEAHQSLWSNTTLNRAVIDEGKLLLDIDNSNELHLGSSGEAFAIQVVIDTYGQLDQVDYVQFFINGETAETLYGHISLDQPFSVDEQLMY
jgi:hypothetical protein